jgi:hypothetical protein
MAFAICNNDGGFLGINYAFACPFFNKKICKEYVEEYGNPRNFGGLF